MGDNSLYDESIILIGPSGAGKTTVSEELSKMLNLRILCLDRIARQYRERGFTTKFKNNDEFNANLIKMQIERVEKIGRPGIANFGAGHSVYEDMQIFAFVKKLLSKFKNIVLLLPSQDIEEALNILKERSTGDYSCNRRFITSRCNYELATITVYENGRTPTEIAEDIIRRIKNKNHEVEDKDEERY